MLETAFNIVVCLIVHADEKIATPVGERAAETELLAEDINVARGRDVCKIEGGAVVVVAAVYPDIDVV